MTTVSAQRHLEREDLAPRVMNVTHRLPALTRWPPGRASRQLARDKGRGGWSGGQRCVGSPRRASAERAWLLVCVRKRRTKLLNVLHLPVGDADLLDRVPVRILHEHVRWRTLRVRHLHVRIVLQLGLGKLLDGRVVSNASAAHVEHGARVHDARVVRLFLAAARALAHQRVALPYELT